MTRRWHQGVLLLAAVTLVGCGRAKVAPPPPPGYVPEDRSTRLGDSIDLNLEAWHQLSRSELARLGDEWAETVEKQLSAMRSNPSSVDLLPRVLPPLSPPVFDKASYSAKEGFSLPGYLSPGKKDGMVAVHLARHGDHEAASKLAPAEVRAELAVWKTEKNYPVEWTRLVGLVLISSQLKLAMGDVDGATQIVQIHKQLRALLDEKAAAGPLGAALLSQGKRALERAALVWREEKRKKLSLADDVDKALQDWGSVPAATPIVAFGAPAAQVSGVLGSGVQGKAVFANKPETVARALDLLGLPFPAEGVKVVSGFLDSQDRLAEWQFAYRAKIDTLYPTPMHVGYRLVEEGFTSKSEEKTPNLTRQTFHSDEVVVEVVRSNRSLALGGLVRLQAARNGRTAASTRNLRDYGPLHLDSGYETNRLALSPTQAGSMIIAKNPTAMQKMARVLDTATPDLVLIKRNREADLLDVLELAWKVEENDHALDRLLPSLWDDYGPGRLDDVEDQVGAYLAFTWQDRTTRVMLRLAYEERGPVLGAFDTQGADRVKARVELARQRDEQERQARLKEGKAELRLSRSPGRINDVSLAKLELGMPSSEVEKILPKGKMYRLKQLSDGVSLVILTTPPKEMYYWARQVLVRYEQGRVNEIRVRYQRGPAKVKSGDPLFDRLANVTTGAPEQIPPTWKGLWEDLPDGGKIVCYRWRDDRTVRIYEQHQGGMEVLLRDRPAGVESLELVPWTFVSTGLTNCELGQERREVESKLGMPVTRNEGGEVYRMPSSSPYEMVVVWYESDRVSRILAIHRERVGSTPKEVEQALAKAWGKNLDALGYVFRQDGARGQVLGAYNWHDDRVRVRLTVQVTDQGARLMTEWRTFPFQVEVARGE